MTFPPAPTSPARTSLVRAWVQLKFGAVLGISLGLGVVCFTSLIFLHLLVWDAPLLAGVSALALSLLLVTTGTGLAIDSKAVTSHGLIAALTILIVGCMAFSGILQAPAAPNLIIVIPAAILLCGLDALKTWGTVVALSFVTMLVLEFQGFLPAIEILDGSSRYTSTIVSFVIGIGICALFSYQSASLTETAVSRLIADKQRYHYDSLHDDLTGLPNRAKFFATANEILEKCSRDQTRFTLLYVDLDGFKEVNDTMGHGVGDELLIAFSERVVTRCQSTDTIARLAGDEFVLICEQDAAASGEALIIERILATTAEPFMINGQELSIGASIGAAVFPRDGDNIDSLLLVADQQMYRTKAARRSIRRTPTVATPTSDSVSKQAPL